MALTMNKKNIAIGITAILIAFVAMVVVTKKIAPLGANYWGEVNESSGVAMHGFDVVSYQTSAGVTEGSETYSHLWQGVNWQFASEENKSMFMSDPEKFAPQYGGYCAFAVSKGVTADPDPMAWHMKEGRLFLFADQDVKAEWIANDYMPLSDENWKTK